MGQAIADKCLYEAWCALADQDDALVPHSFITNLAAQLDAAAGASAVKTRRDILSRSGIGAADLPRG